MGVQGVLRGRQVSSSSRLQLQRPLTLYKPPKPSHWTVFLAQSMTPAAQ